MPVSDACLRAARACIAAVVAPGLEGAQLGGVELRRDQRETVARVRALLVRDGGCVLADDVGRGKTFVALAVARHWSQPLVVVPASLRTTWLEAMRRAGGVHAIITHEALSHGRAPAVGPDFVVVDESHRFRNPHTRRHAALARIAARCPVLMLSATPVQNATRDLAAQLSLFLGSSAFHLDDGALSRHVVRGSDTGAIPGLPGVAPPRWIWPGVDDGNVLRAILALPAPPRPLGAGDAGTLRTIALVRAWASSRAALRATLAKRRRLGIALEQSAEGGRLPTRRELRAWLSDEGSSVQLGLVQLLAEERGSDERLMELIAEIGADRDACASLEEALRQSSDPDVARCKALSDLRRAHPHERVLCFSERATTVRAFFAALRHEPGVGMLTATESRIASGRLPREELLALFAPNAQGAPQPAERERVTLLLATDLLSEGMNLQDASVVVHLDLPWNPARLAQRVGRVRRVGGAVVVRSYLLAPPAESELLLQVEERLRCKLASAEATIGRSMTVIPTLTERSTHDQPTGRAGGAPSAAMLGRTLERVARWRGDVTSIECNGPPIVAGVQSARRGWLAAFSDGRLVASLDSRVPDSERSVADAVVLADGGPRALSQTERDDTLVAVERWRSAALAADYAGVDADSGYVQRLTLARAAAELARAPRHTRATLAPLVATLRHAFARPASLGVERELAALLERSTSHDDAQSFVRAAIEIARRDGGAHERCSGRELVAVVAFGTGIAIT